MARNKDKGTRSKGPAHAIGNYDHDDADSCSDSSQDSSTVMSPGAVAVEGRNSTLASSANDDISQVAAAGETNTREIAESERLILEHTNLLGIILNKGEQTDTKKYYY